MPVITKRKHTPQFKLDVALKALISGKSAETARQYGVTTGLVSKWIVQLKTNGSSIFTTSPDKDTQALKAKVSQLEQLVGQKEVELSLLKNFMDFYAAPNGK
jgi:transposase